MTDQPSGQSKMIKSFQKKMPLMSFRNRISAHEKVIP